MVRDDDGPLGFVFGLDLLFPIDVELGLDTPVVELKGIAPIPCLELDKGCCPTADVGLEVAREELETASRKSAGATTEDFAEVGFPACETLESGLLVVA